MHIGIDNISARNLMEHVRGGIHRQKRLIVSDPRKVIEVFRVAQDGVDRFTLAAGESNPNDGNF